jgi:LysR family glycine cleavage system transcriptional activator
MRPAPLHALHAFESAARLLSYSRAADELHVTHSAVSQQIRGLEESLGVALFERQGRQMLLTREGALLLRRVQPALRQIGRAVSEISTLQRAPSITVATLQSFANRWLLSRIARFQKLQPDVVIHIHGSTGLADLERGEADIAIRYGRGDWKGCASEKLMEEWLFPVCSPAFNNGRLPKTPAGLKRHRILRDDCQGEWDAWAHGAGIDLDGCRYETGYSDSNLMLGAAIEGHGIAIGRSALVSADLAAGRLVRMFDLIIPAPFGYHLVTAAGRAKPPHLQEFEDWLRDEAASFERKERKQLGV